jgi:hypothetical protein
MILSPLSIKVTISEPVMHRVKRKDSFIPKETRPEGYMNQRVIIEGDLIMNHNYKKKTEAEKLLLKIMKSKHGDIKKD